MASGADHYREGERLLEESQTEDAPEWVIARAQQALAHFAAAQAAVSEWRVGFRTCERCPSSEQTEEDA